MDHHSEDESHQPLFFEDGKLARSFSKIQPINVDSPSVFKAFHRFEGKWYVIKRFKFRKNVDVAFQKPRLLQTFTELNRLCHPGLLTYYTCWAEQIGQALKLFRPNLTSNRFRKFSEVIDSSSDDSVQVSDDERLKRNASNAVNSYVAKKSQKEDEVAEKNFAFFFVQMEFCKGVSLKQHLRQSPICNSEAFWIFTKLIEALAYLHANNVCHRNLKPSKIFISNEEIKLADFGIEGDEKYNHPLDRHKRLSF